MPFDKTRFSVLAFVESKRYRNTGPDFEAGVISVTNLNGPRVFENRPNQKLGILELESPASQAAASAMSNEEGATAKWTHSFAPQ